MKYRLSVFSVRFCILVAAVAAVSCTPLDEAEQDKKIENEKEQREAALYARGDQPQEQSDLWIPKTAGELPIIYIKADRSFTKETYSTATFTIVDRDCKYSQTDSVVLKGKVRKRGNSTLTLSGVKFPMRIKFDSGCKLLGMDKNKDWNLLANYTDKTLVRNAFAWKLSRFLGMPWTNKYRHVEVVLNNRYRGLYTLTQTNEVANHRAELNTPEEGSSGKPEDYDYYFELDNTEWDTPEHSHFVTTIFKIPVTMKEPEVLTAEQRAYLTGRLRVFEEALKKHPGSGENGPHQYMDMHSFVTYYLINELSKNMDGNLCRSTFMALKDGKFYFENLWDFDLAFGNADNFEVWDYPSGPVGFFINDYNWYRVLYYKDREFREELLRQWDLVYPALEDIIADVQEETDDFAPARERNFEAFNILPIYVWSNLYYGGSYQDYLDFMFNYTRERAKWLDGKFRNEDWPE